MYRIIKNLPKIDIAISKNETLPILRVGIFLWSPDESYRYLPTPPAECPVCGNSEFKDREQLSALLNPTFENGENGLSILILVRVHPECLEDCIETDEPEPIPW